MKEQEIRAERKNPDSHNESSTWEQSDRERTGRELHMATPQIKLKNTLVWIVSEILSL